MDTSVGGGATSDDPEAFDDCSLLAARASMFPWIINADRCINFYTPVTFIGRNEVALLDRQFKLLSLS
jgi:hypothetical protein